MLHTFSVHFSLGLPAVQMHNTFSKIHINCLIASEKKKQFDIIAYLKREDLNGFDFFFIRRFRYDG